MKMIRDCPVARWFPSRHRFALTRLIAFLRARYSAPPPIAVDHLMLVIDRDQSAIENYAISIWMFVTGVCFTASALPLLAAIPVGTLLIQVLIVVAGGMAALVSKSDNHLRWNSIFLMTVMIAASAYLAAVEASPVRYVAWSFLLIVSLNAIAWMILTMLRNSVRELEQRCGE